MARLLGINGPYPVITDLARRKVRARNTLREAISSFPSVAQRAALVRERRADRRIFSTVTPAAAVLREVTVEAMPAVDSMSVDLSERNDIVCRHAFKKMSAIIDISLVVALLVGTNILAHITTTWASVLVVPFAAILMVIIMRRRGIGFRELGLAPSTWRTGLRYSVVIIAVVAAVIGIGVALPATRAFFLNARYASIHGAVTASLIIIPLITVIPEEIFFRGILQGTLSQVLNKKGVFIVGSVMFGLWHILSSLGMSVSNQTLGGLFGGGLVAKVGCIGLAVLATSIAGMVFTWLRRRSGSLLAPIALHWALNGSGALAAAVVWHMTVL